LNKNSENFIEDLKKKIISTLIHNSSDKERIIQSRFFKAGDNIKLIGVKGPVIVKVCGNALDSVSLSKKDILYLSKELLKEKIHEYKVAGISVLKLKRELLDLNDIEYIKELFLKNYFNNWALIDTISLGVIGYLISKEKSLVDKVTSWRKYDNIYIKRASIVSLIKLIKYVEVDYIFNHCQYFFSIQHDLITKANGWLLREVGKLDMLTLKKFLISNIQSIPRTTLRYAIEKFPEQERKDILSIPYR